MAVFNLNIEIMANVCSDVANKQKRQSKMNLKNGLGVAHLILWYCLEKKILQLNWELLKDEAYVSSIFVTALIERVRVFS